MTDRTTRALAALAEAIPALRQASTVVGRDIALDGLQTALWDAVKANDADAIAAVINRCQTERSTARDALTRTAYHTAQARAEELDRSRRTLHAGRPIAV